METGVLTLEGVGRRKEIMLTSSRLLLKRYFSCYCMFQSTVSE